MDRPFVVAGLASKLRCSIDSLLSTFFSGGLTKAIILDFFERAVITLMFAHFAFQMTIRFLFSFDIALALIIISEVVPVALIVCRRRANTYSDRPIDWVLGFYGASLPLLIEQGAVNAATLQVAGEFIMTIGMLTQISAKVALGRSFGVVAANRGVKVTGLYRFVRHPMYAGYTITQIGFLVASPSWHNTIIYSTVLAIQFARILREERLLNQDPSYRDYASRVQYRLVPKIF